jgi:hypothetical protein
VAAILPDWQTGCMSFGINLDEDDWARLVGGYRHRYDPREALRMLLQGVEVEKAWRELWNELHHQNDVDTASYAAVPALVHIYELRGVPHYNTYALVTTIELARQNGRNPDLPENLRAAYEAAWQKLVEIGLRELKAANTEPLVSCIIAVLAIAKGQRDLCWFATNYDESERREILERAEVI